ncbi:hypothetical protein FGG08_005683 [Glutinoglossum americanum]|uniref:Heterokaryon incompatibility domain-containing protein n=1 Tax=Glutinoglossum americanum TaxID=1670608 RepID=A0A9P8L1L2_9PEZI|nr:hypothetical protein FGG08_005683 [Glutinoglossum americanum]
MKRKLFFRKPWMDARKYLAMEAMGLRAASFLADHLLDGCHQTGEAKALIRTTIKLRQRTLGPQHPDDYVRTHGGEFQSARSDCEDALSSFQKIFEHEHPATENCAEDLQEIIEAKLKASNEDSLAMAYPPLNTADRVAISQQVGSSLGHTSLPGTAGGLAPPVGSEAVRVTEYQSKPHSPHACSQCRKITLDALLKARATVLDNPEGMKTISAGQSDRPLALSFRNPSESSQACPSCRLILGHLAESKSDLSLEFRVVVRKNDNERFEYIDVVYDLNDETPLDRILTYAMPDDKQDWLQEAPRMGSIYEKSYVMPAAAAAADGSLGLFAPLQNDEIDVRFKEVKDGPLNSRGWVLRERLLSRRTTHFAVTQVYWKCGKSYEAQDQSTHNLLQDSSSRGLQLLDALRKFTLQGYTGSIVPANKPESYSDEPSLPSRYGLAFGLQECWRSIAVAYSKCGLTPSSDKLPALLGLAAKTKEITSLRYSHGHWFDCSVNTTVGLLWSPRKKPMDGPLDHHAPSWSWAALDGEIEFLLGDLDVTRLNEKPSDLKIQEEILSTVFRPANSTSLLLTRLVKASTRLYCGPDPRSRFYRTGGAFNEYDWYRTSVDVQTATGDQPERTSEFHARTYPNADRLSFDSDSGYVYVSLPASEPEPPPGIRWVCFDCVDNEPEQFDQMYACTRQFEGRNRAKMPRYLAITVTKRPTPHGELQYRRVGVAQVHKKDWIQDGRTQSITLV